jgi:hypothetical protein
MSPRDTSKPAASRRDRDLGSDGRLGALRFPQPFLDALAELLLESGTFGKEILELPHREDHELRVLPGDRALGVSPAEQEGVLAEELARLCVRDLDFAAVLEVDDLNAAGEDDEERVGIRVLLEDDAALVPAEVTGGAHELDQRSVVELGKEGDAPQGGHEAVRDRIGHWSRLAMVGDHDEHREE